MAEPGRAAHESAAETGAETVARDVGKTAAVPNSTPTDAVELAWSDNPERGDYAEVPGGDIPDEPAAVGQSWRATWRIAGGLVVAGLVVAGAIVVGRWALTTSHSPTNATNPPSPTTSSAAPTATAPSSIASTPDQDDKYIQALNDKGISFANPGAAIYNGKTVCQNIGQGMTVQEVATAFRASSPAFSANADDFVAISVRAYCPQHNNLVAGLG
ncbi:DUF732 domain-containing protein [Mycobacterium conspicuum]|jgi:hypothetical protein|uniref:Uncharacterized protein n=1 Tax=Mycobacterium conspicuum TaxID=44010 RepID=A0A1X1TH56_9MYCO|nr:DUF732 domain-containing protein [Mycobacterium conspicuum]ORV43905.1 hypothetical protein AWC00_09485 [Mycobacterium conspicuum]BBZ38167.1 hypothetical protein MCNS_12300 [Mycobacterium conspicuum]